MGREDNNTINKEKHKISFETAAYVFDDPYYIEMFDFEHSVDEEIENEEYRSKLIVINDNGILNHYTESKKNY